jgi:hypothetical protein
LECGGLPPLSPRFVKEGSWRRNGETGLKPAPTPGFRGGFYGGGLASSTAQVWFPLSKKACLLITHDNKRKRKFFELLESGKVQEAEAIRAELPEISGCDIDAEGVQAVNQQTIVNADRFVFSPFESDEIPRLFKGECQNYRIVVG